MASRMRKNAYIGLVETFLSEKVVAENSWEEEQKRAVRSAGKASKKGRAFVWLLPTVNLR